MKTRWGILLIVALLPQWLRAQQADCSTIGFDSGTTAGWTLSNGRVGVQNRQTIFTNEVPGTYQAGHLVTKISDGNDPRIRDSRIPMVAPGSQYSLRIGNSGGGSRFDRIRTSIRITPDNAIFQYRFAIVLEDPDHLSYEQPAFRIRVLNSSGGEIGCGYYEVSAAKQIAGFQTQDALRYRNWTTGAINLRAFLGQTLTIEVTTNDCTQGAHAGYAYFDAQCIKPEIVAATNCPNNQGNLVLKAPDGFESYQWNTGVTSSSLTIQPKEGDQYSVKISPFSSLNTDCSFTLTYTVPKLQTTVLRSATICEEQGYTVGNTTYRTSGTFTRRIRRAGQDCDSIVTAALTVRPLARFTNSVTLCAGESLTVSGSVYDKSGTYTNRIRRALPLCDSIVTTVLTIRPLVQHAHSATICAGDSYSVGSSVYRQAGTYVDRIDRRFPLCDSLVTTTLTIRPLTQFTHSVSICAGESFTVGSSVYTVTGTYTDRLARRFPLCDSVVTTALTVRPLVEQTRSVTICTGDSYTVGRSVYRQAGTYNDRIARPFPLCDSVVTTNLATINPVLTLTGGSIYERGDSIRLRVVIDPPGTYQFQWAPPGLLSCPTCPNPKVSPAQTTTYRLTVSTDGGACLRTGETTVLVETCTVYLPSAFTPNGDGTNDLFGPIGRECVEQVNELVVYNRWGEIIHRRLNFPISDSTAGWNGTYLNQPAGAGPYSYRVDYRRKNGRNVVMSGNVLLIR